MVKIKAEESSPSRRPAEALTDDVMEFIQFPVVFFLNAQIVARTKLLRTGFVAKGLFSRFFHVLMRFEVFSNGCMCHFTLCASPRGVRRARSRQEAAFHH